MTPCDSEPRDLTSCPDESQLEAHYRGELDEPTAAAVTRHLSGCQRCRSVHDQIAGGDEIGSLLREAQEEMDTALRKRLISSATTALRRRKSGSTRKGE